LADDTLFKILYDIRNIPILETLYTKLAPNKYNNGGLEKTAMPVEDLAKKLKADLEAFGKDNDKDLREKGINSIIADGNQLFEKFHPEMIAKLKE